MSTTTDVDVTAAATAAAALVPAPVPLTATVAPPPAADAPAIVVGVVGGGASELALVLGPHVAQALVEGTGGAPVDAAAALQPALQAAADALGGGVLEPSRTVTAGAVVGGDSDVVALEGGGTVHAWLVVRRRSDAGAPARRDAALPTQRGAALRALYDVELTLTAEIGRARLPLREVLDLTPGTVLELDRAAGGPADVVVNGRLVARGEVVVVDEDFAIRITEIVSAADAG